MRGAKYKEICEENERNLRNLGFLGSSAKWFSWMIEKMGGAAVVDFLWAHQVPLLVQKKYLNHMKQNENQKLD